jgi:hypothetical protein
MTRAKNQSKAELDAPTETPPFTVSEPRRRAPAGAGGKKARDHALARQRARERAARDD